MHQYQETAVLIVAFVLAAFTTNPRATAQTTLLGDDLEPVKARLKSIKNGEIAFFDAGNTLQTTPLAKFLRISFDFDQKQAPKPDLATVELTDGQTLIGAWMGGVDDGQSARINHPVFGEVTIPLDNLASVRFAADTTIGSDTANDMLVFKNGDRMEGFILAIADEEVEFAPAGAADDAPPIELPIARLAGLRLGNDASTPPANTHLLHLTDGSKVRVSSLALAGDRLNIAAVLPGGAAKSVEVPTNRLVRIDLAGGKRKLVSLADQPFEVTGNGRVFGRTIRPRITGDAIRLHAPITVKFTLPRGAKRIAMTAKLDTDPRPRDLGSPEWADFDMRISEGDQVRSEYHFDFDRLRSAINFELKANQVTIELDDAANGPIMDRLLITDAVILVEQK